jgi:hypothetical protein
MGHPQSWSQYLQHKNGTICFDLGVGVFVHLLQLLHHLGGTLKEERKEGH